MAHDPKAIARRYFDEFWNQGRIEVADEIMSSDIVGHDGGNLPLKGTEAVKSYARMMRSAFPDLMFDVTHQILEGDLVASRWVASATHKGDFQGIPATGKRATVTGIHLQLIKDGKIVEGWVNWHGVGLLQNLGVLPAPK